MCARSNETTSAPPEDPAGGSAPRDQSARPPRPSNFQVHLTDDCNFHCLHCYGDDRGTYLDAGQFDYILNEVLVYARFLGRTPYRAIFCGGEPTLSPILLDCMEKCRRAGFRKISLLSNGSGMTDDYADRLVRAGCSHVQICIEGNRATHEAIRDSRLEDILKAWAVCRAHGLVVLNQTCVTALNFRQIDEIVDICQGRVDAVSFVKEVPHNAGHEPLTAEQWLEALERVFYRYCRKGQAYRDFVYVKDLHWSHMFCPTMYSCGLKLEYPLLPIVEANGDVYGCRRGGVVLGNIFRKPLLDVYRTSDILKKTTDPSNLKGKCGACAHREVCGGCRGTALVMEGDILAEDPHCVRDELCRISSCAAQGGGRGGSAAVEVSARKVRQYMRIASCYDLDQAIGEATAAQAAAAAARKAGLAVSQQELQELADLFRLGYGLTEESRTRHWLQANGMAVEALEEALEVDALVRKWKDRLAGAARPPAEQPDDQDAEAAREGLFQAWLRETLTSTPAKVVP